MKTITYTPVLLTAFILIVSCSKEFSFEGSQNNAAKGELYCGDFIVHGNYSINTPLTDSNYISAAVNVSHPGFYRIYSDTINGFYFGASGHFETIGKQKIILKSSGDVKALGTSSLHFHFGASECLFTILPDKAVYTFIESNGNCNNNVVHGYYKAGKPVSVADSVSIQVNVRSAGTYELQTQTVNGMSFAAKGLFKSVGIQTINLHGTGTPKRGGAFMFPVIINNSSCTFSVVVGYRSADTTMYYRFVADGKIFSGYLDSAYLGHQKLATDDLYTLSAGTLLSAATDTIFTLNISRVNNYISTGTYHSALFGSEDFAGGIDFSTRSSFLYSSSRYLPSFKINLTNYNTNSRLIKGDFYGPAINPQGQTVNITNGEFKTFLAH